MTDDRPAPAADPEPVATVLVVEDDPTIQELVAGALEDTGYQTLTAVGSASVALAHTQQPAVILLDVLMPQMDGLAVSHALKANPTTAYIPIVAMSTSPDLRHLSAEMHADAVLAKPFELDDLYRVVRRWASPPADQSPH